MTIETSWSTSEYWLDGLLAVEKPRITASRSSTIDRCRERVTNANSSEGCVSVFSLEWVVKERQAY